MLCHCNTSYKLHAYFFSTFGGNPLTCAAGVAMIDAVVKEKLDKRAAKLGNYFLKRLRELADRHEAMDGVRGKRLMIGVEFVKDRKTKEPVSGGINDKLKYEMKRREVIALFGCGRIMPH